MRGFTLNLLMALVWALFDGGFDARSFLVGFLMGFLVLFLFPAALGTRSYVTRTFAIGRFIGFFMTQLTIANVQVAFYTLRKNPPLFPMIVAVPLRVRSDAAQTLLAATITLMPGTVAMGFSQDRRILYAHAIGLPDPQAVKDSITVVEDQLLSFWSEAAREDAPDTNTPSTNV